MPVAARDTGVASSAMPADHTTVLEEIRAEARAQEASARFPAPLAEKARTASAWMGAGDTGTGGGGDVRFAADLLTRQATRHLEPPAVTGSGIRRLVKRVVVALVGWYGRFLCQHLGAVGQAFSRLGVAVADRVEGLESGQARDREAMRAELDELRARVAHLEAALAGDEQAALAGDEQAAPSGP